MPDCPICGAKDMACVVGQRGPGVSIARLPKEAPSMYTSDQRLYVNADRSKIVREHDPDAAFLLVGEGGQITDEEARKYGLAHDETSSEPMLDPGDASAVGPGEIDYKALYLAAVERGDIAPDVRPIADDDQAAIVDPTEPTPLVALPGPQDGSGGTVQAEASSEIPGQDGEITPSVEPEPAEEPPVETAAQDVAPEPEAEPQSEEKMRPAPPQNKARHRRGAEDK